MQKIISLDTHADFISVYNINCKLELKIIPGISKLKRDIIVLSFAYSERQARLGATLKDFSLSFWDMNDSQPFEKNLSTIEHCQDCQQVIWFLEGQNAWVTSDNNGLLHTWDLVQEVVQSRIQLKIKSVVSAMCELASLHLVALVQEGYYEDEHGHTHNK
jgi:WD40 repeat protein